MTIIVNVARRWSKLTNHLMVPYFQPFDLKHVVRVCTHIALENLPTIKVKTVELLDSFASTEGPLISQIVVDVLGDLPLIQVS